MVSRVPRCLGHLRRGIADTSREERANRHLKGGEGRRPPLKWSQQERHKHNTTTQHHQQHTTTQHHQQHATQHDHHTTTHPPTITAARAAVVLCLLCLCLSSPSCLVSVLTRVCLCVLMYVCSSVCLSLSVFLSVCHRDIEEFVV